MQENRKSNLFVRIAPFVLAPLLFGISALLLSLGNYMGPWYYILYFLSHFLSVGAVFLALHLVFKASAERKMPKALTAAIPLLTSLSVFHVAISIYEAYFLHYEEASTTAIYRLAALRMAPDASDGCTRVPVLSARGADEGKPTLGVDLLGADLFRLSRRRPRL